MSDKRVKGSSHRVLANNKSRVDSSRLKQGSPEKGASMGEAFERKAAQVLAQSYRAYLKAHESIAVSTEVSLHFSYCKVEVITRDNSEYFYIEAQLDCEKNGIDNPLEALDECLDFANEHLFDYFAADRITHLAPVWQSFEANKRLFLVRAERTSPSVDADTNAFLAQHGFGPDGEEL